MRQEVQGGTSDPKCPKCGSHDIDLAESKTLTASLLECIRAKNWHEANVLFNEEMQKRIYERLAEVKTRVMMEDEKRCELCGSTKNVTMVDGTPLCAKCDPESDLDEATADEYTPVKSQSTKEGPVQAEAEGIPNFSKQAKGTGNEPGKKTVTGWAKNEPGYQDEADEFTNSMEKGDGTTAGGSEPTNVTEVSAPGQEAWIKGEQGPLRKGIRSGEGQRSVVCHGLAQFKEVRYPMSTRGILSSHSGE